MQKLYNRLQEVLYKEQLNFELIFVDDYSIDNSYSIIEEIRKTDYRVKIIKLAHNHGQHNATLCGLKFSQGDFVITMDDDLQHPPEEVPKLISGLKAGYDVVFGVPEVKEQSRIKNLGSILIDKSLNIIVNKSPELKVGSFRGLRRALVDKMLDNGRQSNYLAALILENAKYVTTIKVKHDPRKYGKSNYILSKSFKLASNLWFNHSVFPLRILTIGWQAIFSLLFITTFGLKDSNNFEIVFTLLITIMIFFSIFTGIVISKYIKVLNKLSKPLQLEIEKLSL